jgi:hypothetical protein
MTISEEEQRKIDLYLRGVRKGLRGMREEDVRDIVEELRSHILDRAASAGELASAGVDSAIAALGAPEELAAQYMTDDLLSRAQASGSLLLVIRSLFRWASISVAGFFILLGSLVSYFLGFALAWAAFLKPIHPNSVGLWKIPQAGSNYEFSLHMGFSGPPAAGQEVLGWWIVPIGILGIGLFFLTLRVDLWSIGRFRRKGPLRSR